MNRARNLLIKIGRFPNHLAIWPPVVGYTPPPPLGLQLTTDEGPSPPDLNDFVYQCFGHSKKCFGSWNSLDLVQHFAAALITNRLFWETRWKRQQTCTLPAHTHNSSSASFFTKNHFIRFFELTNSFFLIWFPLLAVSGCLFTLEVCVYHFVSLHIAMRHLWMCVSPVVTASSHAQKVVRSPR